MKVKALASLEILKHLLNLTNVTNSRIFFGSLPKSNQHFSGA